MKQIGLIVNPVAGMGGAVGLKGTDGEMYTQALALGAEPVTPARTRDLLRHISTSDQFTWLAAPGPMGAELLQSSGAAYRVVGELSPDGKTGPADTVRIARQMQVEGADLMVFVGGDGTARNIFDAIGMDIPVVAVPSGVKIFSGVFAVNAAAAARLVDAFLAGSGVSEEEVLDIDEEAYRHNRLQSHLYGYLRVPKLQGYVQHSKSASSAEGGDLENKYAAAEWVVEKLAPDVMYLLGPGTTVQAITEILELEKTLLGVDAYYNQQIIEKDLNASGILRLLNEYPRRKIVVTPIGGNGFIFGRGNKQFTPQILKLVGTGNILIISTKDKMSGIDNLRVDTGDSGLDQALAGYREVVVGYRESRMVKVL